MRITLIGLSHKSAPVELRERLVRIEMKLDIINGSIKDHETRIRAGEYRLWWLAGAWAMITAGAAYIFKVH